VPPSDYSVVTNVPDRNLLTLITCHPKYTAKSRLVVTAEFDPTVSSSLATAEINYGREASDLESGSDGLAEETDASGPADAGVDPTADGSTDGDPANPDASSATPISEPAISDGSATPATDGAPEDDGAAAETGTSDQSADAFGAGWFSDPDAWPQVALWGFACTFVSLLAWLLGRKTRNWFSALVGIGPFVVVLYFFFENVNRLLPPNL
jgi:sortase A